MRSSGCRRCTSNSRTAPIATAANFEPRDIVPRCGRTSSTWATWADHRRQQRHRARDGGRLASQGANVAIWGTNEHEDTGRRAAEPPRHQGAGALMRRRRRGRGRGIVRGDRRGIRQGRLVLLERRHRRRRPPLHRPAHRGVAPGVASQPRRRVLHVAPAVRHMVERGEGGSVVVTSSVSTLMGAPRNQAYASAKGRSSP